MRLLILLLATAQLAAANASDWQRPVATYSIVARDSLSGQLGVAIQSSPIGFPLAPLCLGPVLALALWPLNPSLTRPTVRSASS